jgi:YfiH family protein
MFEPKKEVICNGVWIPSSIVKHSSKIALGVLTKQMDFLGDEKEKVANFLHMFAPNSYPHYQRTKLNHGDKIVTVDYQYLEQINMSGYQIIADGIMTDIPGMPLLVRGADCASVCIYDPVNQAVGLFHCGWRGTAKKLAVKGVKRMQDFYGSEPRDLVIIIGPHAGALTNEYEVGEDVLKEFSLRYKDIAPFFCESRRNKGKYLLSLAGAITISLLEVGVLEYNVQQSYISTMGLTGGGLFHSERIERERREGRTSPMVAVLK